MTNTVQLKFEGVLGAPSKTRNQRESLMLKASQADTIAWWMQGKFFDETQTAIATDDKEEYTEFSSFNDYCKAYSEETGIEMSGVKKLKAAWLVVRYLHECGVEAADLPKKPYHTVLLSKHDQEDWVKVWKEFVSTGDRDVLEITAADYVEVEEVTEDAAPQTEKGAVPNDEVQNAAECIMQYIDDVELNDELYDTLFALSERLNLIMVTAGE